jgi:hypothetical protein
VLRFCCPRVVPAQAAWRWHIEARNSARSPFPTRALGQPAGKDADDPGDGGARGCVSGLAALPIGPAGHDG